jgi:hypothetical protein
MSIQGRRASAACVLVIAVLAASSLTCDFIAPAAKPVAEAIDPILNPRPGIPIEEAEARAHFRETAVALSLTQTAIAELQAEQAAEEPDLPAELPPGAHPPVITRVEFPSSIAATGVYVRGHIAFTDAGHDVNRVSLTAIEGNFSGSWDPTGIIAWTGDTGVTPFDGACQGPQTVRTRITLQDAAGNTSGPAQLTFTCQ